MQADKPALTDKQKEARWMLYLSPLMIFSGVVLLVVSLTDWVKSPKFLSASSLIGDTGFLLFGVSGFVDAKRTLRTGIKRLSAGRFAGLLLALLSWVGQDAVQHKVPASLLRFLGFSFLLIAVCGLIMWWLRVAGARWEKEFYDAKNKS